MNRALVSIIIRTCQRPYILKRALESIVIQSYPEIQVVIVEDGNNESEKFIKENFSMLNICYVATGKKVGRAKAGNIGLELSEGVFLNFLDDDDMLFENHVQTLVETLKKVKNRAAYSIAEERRLKISNTTPNDYKIKGKSIRFKQPYNRMLLYTFNYIPIQSIMFHRSLYEQLGGFDEHLDALEDWDLWVRYSTKTDFCFVEKTTSCYHVPYEKKLKKRRAENLSEYRDAIYENFSNYEISLNIRDINKEMTYVIREYKNNGIIRYIRMFFRALFFGER